MRAALVGAATTAMVLLAGCGSHDSLARLAGGGGPATRTDAPSTPDDTPTDEPSTPDSEPSSDDPGVAAAGQRYLALAAGVNKVGDQFNAVADRVSSADDPRLDAAGKAFAKAITVFDQGLDGYDWPDVAADDVSELQDADASLADDLADIADSTDFLDEDEQDVADASRAVREDLGLPLPSGSGSGSAAGPTVGA